RRSRVARAVRGQLERRRGRASRAVRQTCDAIRRRGAHPFADAAELRRWRARCRACAPHSLVALTAFTHDKHSRRPRRCVSGGTPIGSGAAQEASRPREGLSPPEIPRRYDTIFFLPAVRTRAILERRSSMSEPVSRLPARASLQQLRKQAKELLRALRAGSAEASQRAAAVVPRFAQPGSVASATLTDAQFILAREYGFDSWPKLVDHV